MPVNNQFSIAVHLMTGLGYGASEATSASLAKSVNTSPSFVRRILAKLSKAELVCTRMGKTGSTSLARDPKDISLLDIYRAVDAPKALAIHEYPVQASCPVSCGIKSTMDKVFDRSQEALEESLAATSLAEVIDGLPK